MATTPADSCLARAIEGVPSLEAAFVVAMPDCLLVEAWMRPELDWPVDEAASWLGDLYRANREGLTALGTSPRSAQITVEAPDRLVLLGEVGRDFLCACVFDRCAALGMARLYLRRVLDRLAVLLPTITGEERPRATPALD
jgi:predicted regulator of Ras-like GTPase activity (Roadblock/LC7/MglB family)